MRNGQQTRMSILGSGAFVVTTNPKSGELTYTSATGRQNAPVLHPYIGPTSWIRVNPERRTKIVINYRGEDMRPYVGSYITEDIEGAGVQSLLEATADGNFYFRELKEGEIQLTSSGLADVSLLANGNLELRGGATTLTLSNTDLEIAAIAPVHRLMTEDSKLQSIGNEMRFGVVTRNSPLDVTQKTAITYLTKQAKEYMVHLSTEGASVPMVDHRVGNVVEDTGMPALLNGVGVRLRSQYGTVSSQKVEFTIDETGNVAVTIPQSTLGFQMQTLLSDIKLTAGKNMNVIVTQNFVASAKKFQYTAQKIQLGGTNRLLTETWSTSLGAANALVPATSTADVVAACNAVIAYLKAINSAFNGALTRITVSG